MNPLVSVIIPIYKVEEYIEQCAESLFLQDWPNLEFIFVDNNTPDNSIGLLENLLRGKYSFRECCTRIVHEKQQGLGYARVAGIKVAKGDYIVHVDSDDWVEPDYVSKMILKAIECNADIVYCNYFKEYSGRKNAKIVREQDLSGCTDAEFMEAVYCGFVQAYNWNKLEKHSLYNLDTLIVPYRNMYEDLFLQTQVIHQAEGIVHVQEPLYHYRRRRKGAVTRMKWSKRRRESVEGLLYLYSALPKTNSPLDYCKQDLLTRAGWGAMTIFRLGLQHIQREILEYLSCMTCQKGHSVPYFRQGILKYFCRMYLWLHS